jgi:hypothetical protein
MNSYWARSSVFSTLLLVASGTAQANGTETLGPPNIAIATGTNVFIKGTGTFTQPGTIDVSIPAGATIKQVLLYWEGFMIANVAGDNSVLVSNNGGATTTPVIGSLIGGQTFFFNNAHASTFRADITAQNLVAVGSTTLEVSSMDFTRVSNGAGVIVIYDAGLNDAGIVIRDGSDLAFINFAGNLKTTVPQTFTFPSSSKDRTAQINMFFASVSGTASTGGFRPSVMKLTTNGANGGTTLLNNLLDSNDGEEWDSFSISIDIPSKATSLTVQALSEDNLGTGRLPASLAWLAAGFAFEPKDCGRMTGGGSVFRIDDVRVTRGFEIHCDLREPNNIQVNWPDNKFHMTELTSAVCTDTVAVQAPPQSSPFDSFKGTGTGRYNNQAGARIEFEFVDAGEPGTSDTALIKVFDSNNTLVLDVPGDPNVSGFLTFGNMQTHKDNKCLIQ